MKSDQLNYSIKALPDIPTTDWQKIMLLRSEVFVSEQKCVYVDPDFEDQIAFHIYRRDFNEITCYARFFKKKNWHLGRIAVKKEQRGIGMSKLMILACIDYIKNTEPDFCLEISAQLYLSDFYSLLNFSPLGSMYLEDGIPHIKMLLNHCVKQV